MTITAVLSLETVKGLFNLIQLKNGGELWFQVWGLSGILQWLNEIQC